MVSCSKPPIPPAPVLSYLPGSASALLTLLARAHLFTGRLCHSIGFSGSFEAAKDIHTLFDLVLYCTPGQISLLSASLRMHVHAFMRHLRRERRRSAAHAWEASGHGSRKCTFGDNLRPRRSKCVCFAVNTRFILCLRSRSLGRENLAPRRRNAATRPPQHTHTDSRCRPTAWRGAHRLAREVRAGAARAWMGTLHPPPPASHAYPCRTAPTEATESLHKLVAFILVCCPTCTYH